MMLFPDPQLENTDIISVRKETAKNLLKQIINKRLLKTDYVNTSEFLTVEEREKILAERQTQYSWYESKKQEILACSTESEINNHIATLNKEI